MDYADLKTYLRNHVHRSAADLPDGLFNNWQTFVVGQLNNLVKLNSYFVTLTDHTPASNPFTIASQSFFGPAAEIIEVTAVTGSTRYKLQAMSRDMVVRLLGGTGQPHGYNAEGDSIRVAPFNDSLSLDIVYRAEIQELDSDTDTETALTEQPNLYVAMFLVQIYGYLRDFEGATAYSNMAQSELDAINRNELYKRALTNTQGEGASQWV
jgi:hypothetical protein